MKQRLSASGLLKEQQLQQSQWKNEHGSSLLGSLRSEPISGGMPVCYSDLTTAETFSGRSSHRKGALGNRYVPVIWAKVFLLLASEV